MRTAYKVNSLSLEGYSYIHSIGLFEWNISIITLKHKVSQNIDKKLHEFQQLDDKIMESYGSYTNKRQMEDVRICKTWKGNTVYTIR